MLILDAEHKSEECVNDNENTDIKPTKNACLW